MGGHIYNVFAQWCICLKGGIPWTLTFYHWHTVYVKIPAGIIIEMSIPWPYTIESLKQVISKEKGIHLLCRLITFNGRVLEDGHKLMEYNMQYGSTLVLVVRPGSKYINCVSLWNML